MCDYCVTFCAHTNSTTLESKEISEIYAWPGGKAIDRDFRNQLLSRASKFQFECFQSDPGTLAWPLKKPNS